MYCRNCGKEYEGNFCPECGLASVKTYKQAEESSSEVFGAANEQEKNQEDSTQKTEADGMAVYWLDKIINGICGVFDMPQLSDDQYRNTMVKRNLAEFLLSFPIMFWLLSLSYRVYKDEGLGTAIVVFLMILIVISIILWIFGFGKVEKRLKKYDLIKKEAGKEAAVISTESSNNINPGCIVMVALILFLMVLMSFC